MASFYHDSQNLMRSIWSHKHIKWHLQMRRGEEQLSCSEINVVSAVELLGHSSIKQQHNGQHHGGAVESWSNIMLRSRGRHRADGSSVAVQLHPSSSPFYTSLFLAFCPTVWLVRVWWMGRNQTDRQGYCTGKDQQSAVGHVNTACAICDWWINYMEMNVILNDL